MDKGKVQRALLPPRPVRLNVNAEVPTPFVVPWSWYIKQRVYWPLPKLLCVTVTADGKLDEARYAALVHEDKQFGLRVSFNQTLALEKYAGYHLVSVSRVGQTQLHYTLTRSACPCSSSSKACGACTFNAIPHAAVVDGAAAALAAVGDGAAAGEAPRADAAEQPAPLEGCARTSSGARAVLLRSGDPVDVGAAAAGVAAPAPRLRGSGGGGSENAESTHSTMTRTGGVAAAGPSGHADAAGSGQEGGLWAARRSDGSAPKGPDGAGGRRYGGAQHRRRRGGGGGRRIGASGMSGGGGGDSSRSEDDSSSSSSDGEESAGPHEPLPHNPFRKDFCSCPCHVWRKYWPDPDDPRKHQDQELAGERDRAGRGRAAGREGRGPRRRSRSVDEDWKGGPGRGRKRSASAEAEPAAHAEAGAAARPARRARVGGGVPPLPRRPPPPVAPRAAAFQLDQPACGAAAAAPGRGSEPVNMRQQQQQHQPRHVGALPPLPPDTAAAAAAAPREATAPLRTEPQESGRHPPQHHPRQSKQQEQQEPLYVQHPPEKQENEKQQPAQRAASDSEDSGGGVAAADGGGLLAGQADHVSVEDADGQQGGGQGDGADQLDSLLPHSGQPQQKEQQQHAPRGTGPRAAAGSGGRPGASRGDSLGSFVLSPLSSPDSPALAQAAAAGTGTGTGPLEAGPAGGHQQRQRQQQQHSPAMIKAAAEIAKMRRAAAIVAKACRRNAAGGSPTRQLLQQQRWRPSGLRSPPHGSDAARTGSDAGDGGESGGGVLGAAGAAVPGLGAGAGGRVDEQQTKQPAMRPLQLKEPALEPSGRAPKPRAPQHSHAAGPSAAAGSGGGGGRGGPLHSSELVNREAATQQQRHKRPREHEPPQPPQPAVEPLRGRGGGRAPSQLMPSQAAAVSGNLQQQQQQVPRGGQARGVPLAAVAGAAAVGAGGAESPPLVLALPGRPICRPAWDVQPLECGTSATRPRPGTRIEGPRLSVDPKVLHGHRGQGLLCFLRIFVERDGYVDGCTEAKCVRVEEAGRTTTLSNVPSHAQRCVFLGWGVLPGGSLVMRVQSATEGGVPAGGDPTAGVPPPPPQAAAVAAAAAALATKLDRRRQWSCLRGTYRSPATQEAAAAVGPGAGESSGVGPVGARQRKLVRLDELLRRAPTLPAQL